MLKYIYQYPEWPRFTWNDAAIRTIYGEVCRLQGRVVGHMNALGFKLRSDASLTTLTLDVVKSSEIEGEFLNYNQVRSSIARRLGMELHDLVDSGRDVDGVVEMMLDATQNYSKPLTEERLCSWHASLFPTGKSGMYKIETGRYRSLEMQIVSGAIGKERIHYEAIPPHLVKQEMDKFLNWFNNDEDGNNDLILKAAIAHFHFIIIHPFDDGNGRIARAITDMLLSRADQSADRYYSMSNRILTERKKYYEVLNKTQHSNGDITPWLEWFFNCLKNALLDTELTLKNILRKSEFWKLHADTELNERQRLILNKLLDGFEGKLKTSKWAKITRCSRDTALRDIKDLIEKKILYQETQGGRSTNYEMIEF
jgi:Fic family protein